MRLDHFIHSDFDRGASLLKEMLWWVVRSLLFAPWFPIPSVLKISALRLFGATVGREVVIRSRVHISFPWRLTLGDHIWIGEEVMILSLAPVKIASHVCISQRAFLCTGSHDFRKESFDLIAQPIVIEEGCWIAASVFIGPGVTLAQGTLCSAGSVVFRDSLPHQLLVGNPAIAKGSTT
jgi:putative colanic acid biosynthesis acetyltransferase WcaF